jgi:hypothetical protein
MKRSYIQFFSQVKKAVKARQWPGVEKVWLATCPKCKFTLIFNKDGFICLKKECGYSGTNLNDLVEETAKHPDLKPVRDLKRICKRREKKVAAGLREQSHQVSATGNPLP